MATRTVVCSECDAPLAPGHFACAACGALLAAVASGSRTLFPIAEPEPEPVVALPEALPEAPRDLEPARELVQHDEEPPVPELAQPEEPPAAAPATLPPGAMWAPPAMPVSPPTPTVAAGPPAPSAAMPVVAAAAPAPTWPGPVEARPDQADATASWPPLAAWTDAPPEPLAAPPPAASNGSQAAASAEPLRNPAGAYLPPSAVLPPAEALPLPSARPARPETLSSVLSESAGSLSLPSDAGAAAITIGAAISAVGFLLPWADVVLGSRGIGTFLDRWGLAAPGHAAILAALLALAAAGTFSHRLPRRLRLGLPSVALGCLLLGLAWPYLFGPFGATVGVYVVTAGGLLLSLAGSLDVVLRRHAAPSVTV